MLLPGGSCFPQDPAKTQLHKKLSAFCDMLILILMEVEIIQRLVVDTQQLKGLQFPSEMQGKEQ